MSALPVANAGGVHIGWDALDDPTVVAYRLRYGGASGHYTNSVLVPNGSSVTISGLTDGVTYYFAVTSFDTSGEKVVPD